MSTASLTTSAPSRPPRSSGSDAPGGAAAVLAPPAGACASCGAALGAAYCGACGQRDLPHNPSARVLVGEAWDTFGTVDGKLVRTVSLLLTRPGALTVEWLRGRRAPYLRPINLYLTVSAAYFAALAATFRPEELAPRRSLDEQRAMNDFRAKVERKYAAASPPKRVLLIGLARFGADPAEAMRVAIPEIPRIMFGLVPLFAVFLHRTLARRGWRYPAHLYFALHVFSFYFAVSIVDRAVQAYGPRWTHSPANWAAGLATLAYLALAMRRVYGGRWWVTGLRVVAVGVPFYLAAVVGLALAGVVLLGMR